MPPPLKKVPRNAYEHYQQCISCQPRSPLLPSIKHLRNDKSKYHIHILSSGGVPKRYGGHQRCLNPYSKTYGSDECVWLKWYGELNGLPYINLIFR